MLETLEGLEVRMRRIELGVKLSTWQTKDRLRYSASKASNESRPDNSEFKLAHIRAYQPQQELKTTLVCMVTGVEVPKEDIVGGHIASHSKKSDVQFLLLIKDIDDVRNGMLWSQPIENAYEDSRICFAFDPEDGEYRLHVLDNALLDLTLADPLPHHSTPQPPLHASSLRPSHGEMFMASVSSLAPLAPDPSSGLLPFMPTWRGISNWIGSVYQTALMREAS